MDHGELIRSIYSNFSTLLELWESRNDENENIGFFVFMPLGYADVCDFADVRFDYWLLPYVRDYLRAGGQPEAGIDLLLKEFDYGREFFVMIVEFENPRGDLNVFIHKISQTGLS